MDLRDVTESYTHTHTHVQPSTRSRNIHHTSSPSNVCTDMVAPRANAPRALDGAVEIIIALRAAFCHPATTKNTIHMLRASAGENKYNRLRNLPPKSLAYLRIIRLVCFTRHFVRILACLSLGLGVNFCVVMLPFVSRSEIDHTRRWPMDQVYYNYCSCL